MSTGGGAGGGGGTCGARALRVLLLAVLALAAVEYLFGSILDTGSGLRSYLYTAQRRPSPPAQDAAPGNDKKDPTWPKRARTRPRSSDSPEDFALYQPNNPNVTDVTNNTINSTHNHTNNTISKGNKTYSTEHDKIGDVNPTQVIKSLMDILKKIVGDKNTDSSQSVLDKTDFNATSKNPDASQKIPETDAKTAMSIHYTNGTMSPSEVAKVLGDVENTTALPKDLCAVSPPDLGPVEVDKKVENVAALAGLFVHVRLGGRFTPAHCRPRHKVALVIPFRDREQHLAVFLKHMHTVLMKQELDYGIFIVEQSGSKPFNRAKLLNVGFVEAQRARIGGWDCFVFHDIDLLPLDSRNLYTCPRQPRHMSAAIDKYNYRLPYPDIFGGVSALTVNQFMSVNGFSNKYWGWGGEDDDMFNRLKKKNYHLSRYPMSIARYTMLHHKPQVANPKRYSLLAQTNKVYTQDGLSSLRYRLVEVALYPLYTSVLANIDEAS